MRLFFAIAASAFMAGPLTAADAEIPTAAELAHSLRSLLILSLPQPLVEQKHNWDHQAMTANGIKWEKKGIVLKPELTKKLQNDGTWRKIVVTADNPEKTLEVRIKDVKLPEAGRLTFAMELHLPVHTKFEQQLWRSGVRLYSGETRARSRVILYLQCESTSRFEKKQGSLLPDLVIRLRVLEAKMTYYDFVVEHTAGVGGDLAKILGNAIHDSVNRVKPALERDLLEKANAAIVKAADTKEVRLSLSKLFDKK